MKPPKDKIMHFVVSAAIFFCLFWIFKSIPLGLLISSIWAFGKEFWDEKHGGKFDWLDILTDYFGVLFAYMVINC